MTFSLPDISSGNPTSVVILGADLALAARPATPVQLAHACAAAGYTAAVPASWGDELIAQRCLQRLSSSEDGAAIMCTCPLARERLVGVGDALASRTISLISPPVAAARYVRSLFPKGRVIVTYVGSCPGANDSSIDEHVEPRDFLSALRERGIAPADQPSPLGAEPADRRRFFSRPGGTPSSDHLMTDGARTLVDIAGDQLVGELSRRLLSGERALLDIALGAGCACSGVVDARSRVDARDSIEAMEPPRATRPVIDPAIRLDLDAPLAAPSAPRVSASPTQALATSIQRLASDETAARIRHANTSKMRRPMPVRLEPKSGPSTRLRAPMRVPRVDTGKVTNSGEGRVFPRAYAGRRKPATHSLTLGKVDQERALTVSSEIPVDEEAVEAVRLTTSSSPPVVAGTTSPERREVAPAKAERRLITPTLILAVAFVLLLLGIVAGTLLGGD
jgi:hypothetical protein